MESLDEDDSDNSDSDSDSSGSTGKREEDKNKEENGQLSNVNIRKQVSRPQSGSATILRSFSAPSVSFADKKF
jgi:hypothetical protein